MGMRPQEIKDLIDLSESNSSGDWILLVVGLLSVAVIGFILHLLVKRELNSKLKVFLGFLIIFIIIIYINLLLYL